MCDPLTKRQVLENAAHGGELEVSVHVDEAWCQRAFTEVMAEAFGSLRGQSYPCNLSPVDDDRAMGNWWTSYRKDPAGEVDPPDHCGILNGFVVSGFGLTGIFVDVDPGAARITPSESVVSR